jgi:nucleoside-diphosphate-sugar epimerase
MRVAITGSHGFLGLHLRRRWPDAICLDRLAPKASHLETYCPKLDVDVIVHAAAHADISHNWESVDQRRNLYRDNVTALINVLEANRGTPVVFMSTAAIHMGAHLSPYAATKAFGESLVRAYCDAASVGSWTIRAVSFVGEGYAHGHIADFVRKRPTKALDNGEFRKPFAHVRDVAEAIQSAAGNAVDGFSGQWTVAGERWGWKDTARVMGLNIAPGTASHGFIGDPVGLDVRSDWPCRYNVADGVRDALNSLGWTR